MACSGYSKRTFASDGLAGLAKSEEVDEGQEGSRCTAPSAVRKTGDANWKVCRSGPSPDGTCVSGAGRPALRCTVCLCTTGSPQSVAETKAAAKRVDMRPRKSSVFIIVLVHGLAGVLRQNDNGRQSAVPHSSCPWKDWCAEAANGQTPTRLPVSVAAPVRVPDREGQPYPVRGVLGVVGTISI